MFFFNFSVKLQVRCLCDHWYLSCLAVLISWSKFWHTQRCFTSKAIFGYCCVQLNLSHQLLLLHISIRSVFWQPFVLEPPHPRQSVRPELHNKHSAPFAWLQVNGSDSRGEHNMPKLSRTSRTLCKHGHKEVSILSLCGPIDLSNINKAIVYDAYSCQTLEIRVLIEDWFVEIIVLAVSPRRDGGRDRESQNVAWKLIMGPRKWGQWWISDTGTMVLPYSDCNQKRWWGSSLESKHKNGSWRKNTAGARLQSGRVRSGIKVPAAKCSDKSRLHVFYDVSSFVLTQPSFLPNSTYTLNGVPSDGSSNGMRGTRTAFSLKFRT